MIERRPQANGSGTVHTHGQGHVHGHHAHGLPSRVCLLS